MAENVWKLSGGLEWVEFSPPASPWANHDWLSGLGFIPAASGSSTQKSIGGTLSFTSGIVTKIVNKNITSVLSFIGALPKTIIKSIAGVLSFAGAPLKSLGRNLTGTLSFTGGLGRAFAKALSGTLSFTGGLGAVVGAAADFMYRVIVRIRRRK